MLEPDEIRAAVRFATRLIFYAYNVATSFLSVLFSEPDGGVFERLRAWVAGDVPPRVYVAVASSCLSTGLIAWVVAARVRAGVRSMRDEVEPAARRLAAVVVANAAMSYVYTKHEILSVAGCFYAVAAFVAARHALDRLREGMPAPARVAIVLVLACTATLWAFRSIGVHHMLRVEAYRVRNDWAGIPAEMWRDQGSPRQRQAAALIRQLRREAWTCPSAIRTWCRRWVDRWWGE